MSVTFLDVDYGIYIGFVYSLVILVIKSQIPKVYLLGSVDNLDVYVPLNKYSRAKEINGIKIYQFCGPLHFANVDYFKEELAKKCQVDIK